MQIYSSEKYYFIWLSLLKLKPVIKVQLLKKYKKPEVLYNKTEEELQKDFEEFDVNEKNREKIIKQITDSENRNKISEKIEKMKKLSIKIITCEEREYPNNLKKIFDFPICLYYKGNVDLLLRDKKIAMIGCRQFSEYGKSIALSFAKELVKNNFIIISGGARGIDSFSHIGALNNKNSTIAVLGNSLEYIYPPENKELEEKILKNGGLLLSEYGIGTKPDKYTFPSRNRIISGISDGVLVIEAKEKSGTLITVDFALEQGKNIYSVPGNITNENSEGTNNLIKMGAKPVTQIMDVTEDFL